MSWDELLGPDAPDPAGAAAEALRQMGQDVMPGYAAHRRRQYGGLPEVHGLAEGLGLR